MVGTSHPDLKGLRLLNLGPLNCVPRCCERRRVLVATRIAMAPAAKRRSGTDMRKQPRRHFQYRAQILIGKQGPLRACSIADISEGGARLMLQTAEDLPSRFVLVLSARGGARRVCRLVWQEGAIAGVEFDSGQF